MKKILSIITLFLLVGCATKTKPQFFPITDNSKTWVQLVKDTPKYTSCHLLGWDARKDGNKLLLWCDGKVKRVDAKEFAK